MCELMHGVSELVHRLQRERGSSQLFLASKGERYAGPLAERVADSLSAEAHVRDWLAASEPGHDLPGGARLLTRIAVALQELNELPELRGRVLDQSCASHVSSQRYNRLVSVLLALVFEAADVSQDPVVARLLVAMFNLMQGKEFAGQERAAGAAGFARGQLGEEASQTILNLIDQQEQCFQRFEAFGEPEMLAQWRALQSLMPLAELARMRRKLIGQAPGTLLDVNLADVWFEVCSQRIDQIHLAEMHLATSLRQTCESRVLVVQAELEDQQAMLGALRAAPEKPELWSADAGIGPRVTRSLLDTLMAQSQRLQLMSDELATVRAALDERKVIERAKGLLMAHQGLSEEEAYRQLRQKAMNQKSRLIEVAQMVISMAEFFPARP